jgi:hypothetical protein
MSVTTGAHKISWSVESGILELIITGEVTAANADLIQNEVFAIARLAQARFALIDVRHLNGRLGYTDAYHRVRSFPVDRPRAVTALVESTENAEFMRFYETTARNAGQNITCFADIEQARAWLKAQAAQLRD